MTDKLFSSSNFTMQFGGFIKKASPFNWYELKEKWKWLLYLKARFVSMYNILI